MHITHAHEEWLLFDGYLVSGMTPSGFSVQ